MKKLSLKQRLLSYLQKHGSWVASGELQRLAMEKGFYSPQNAGRRLRELECDNQVEVEYRHGHAWYRSKIRQQKVVWRLPTGEIVKVGYE